MDLNDAIINRSNTDSADRKPVDTGSIPDGITHTVKNERNPMHRIDFSQRGNHGQPHQSHMMRFSGRQQFNNQPRQFVQQNRHFNLAQKRK
ncbi:hypothetical protein TNCV_3844921 [Trichonephila clavipes]|nr:hypothetical protein TNCV_3844921 [Trichonephila clavipes]